MYGVYEAIFPASNNITNCLRVYVVTSLDAFCQFMANGSKKQIILPGMRAKRKKVKNRTYTNIHNVTEECELGRTNVEDVATRRLYNNNKNIPIQS